MTNGVLALKTILRIYCKLLSRYLTIKDILEGSKKKLRVGLKAKSRAEGPSNLSSSILTKYEM